MKRALKLVGLGLAAIAVAFAGLLAVTFSGPSIPDGLTVGQVEVVKDGFVSSYVVALPGGGVRVGRALADGEAIDLGGTVARVFAVPGHTPGSAAYLVEGVLFLGDSAETTRDGGVAAGRWLFTSDPARNRASLAALAARLAPEAAEVQAIACSHSGVLTTGLEPLLAFARAGVR